MWKSPVNNTVLHFLKLHNVKSLVLNHKSFSRKQIAAALQENITLTSLTFNKVHLETSETLSETVEKVNLNNLNYLKIVKGDMSVLALVSTTSLKRTSFNCFTLATSIRGISLAVALLTQQTSLEKLVLDGKLGPISVLNEGIISFPFKLKYLQIEMKGVDLIDLLKRHLATLQVLCLNFELDEAELAFVLRHSSNIHSLQIRGVNKLPQATASEFWDGIEPLNNIQELSVHGSFKNEADERNIVPFAQKSWNFPSQPFELCSNAVSSWTLGCRKCSESFWTPPDFSATKENHTSFQLRLFLPIFLQ